MIASGLLACPFLCAPFEPWTAATRPFGLGGALGAATGASGRWAFTTIVRDTFARSWNVPTISASCSDCDCSSVAAELVSSEAAAFCCVTLFIWVIARLTCSMPVDCSRAAAATSAMMSLTFVIDAWISASRSFTFLAVTSPCPASFTD